MNRLKVALLALACFATSISEFAIVGMIDVVAESAGVSVGAHPLCILSIGLLALATVIGFFATRKQPEAKGARLAEPAHN